MLASIMLIASVFDYTEKMDDFAERNAPLVGLLFDYYLNFIILYGNMFAPMLIFITVIYFTSKMAARTEIVAILSSGVSFRRLMVPYLIVGVLLAGFSLFNNHYLVPHANKSRIAFEEQYFKIAFKNFDKDIHKRISDNDVTYFEKYNAQSNIGYKFTLEHWDNDELTFKLWSDYTQYDSVNGVWKVHNYTKRFIYGDSERVESGVVFDTILDLHPEEFERRLEYTTQMMTTNELDEFIAEEIHSGSVNVPFHLIEKHQRSALPFSTFIMIIIGVSISSRKARGGIGAHLAFGLLIAVSYIFIGKVSTVYATNAGLSAFWACWIPNIVYTGLAAYILQKAPK